MRTRNGCRTPRPPELAGWVERSEAHLSRASRGRWASFVSPPCEAAEAPARWRTTIPVGATLVVAPIWHPRRIPGRHGIAVRGGHGDRGRRGRGRHEACPYGGVAGNKPSLRSMRTWSSQPSTCPDHASTCPKDLRTLPKRLRTLPSQASTYPDHASSHPKDLRTYPKGLRTLPPQASTYRKDLPTLPRGLHLPAPAGIELSKRLAELVAKLADP